ncbi:MAG: squalene/phytoene synthase family protein [Dongiaceae bacterium]
MTDIAHHPSGVSAKHRRAGEHNTIGEEMPEIAGHGGSSFFGAIPFLSASRRNAIYALNAFCSEVDEIANGESSHALKHALLSDWRCEIARLFAGEAQHRLTRALAAPVFDYDLRCEHFLAVIEGAEMDARTDIRAPSLEELDLYCARGAVATCLLSMGILGVETPAAERIAAELGRAVQLTTILRNLAEDADRHRLYLPRDLLGEHGIFATTPSSVLAHPALPHACRDLAARAEQHYAAAAEIIRDYPVHAMRAIALALHLHRTTLRALVARGWQRLDEPVQIPSWRKTALIFRFGLIGR